MSRLMVKSDLPENYKDWMIGFFLKKQNSKIYVPKIKRLKDVFVTNQGLVVKNNFLVRRCAFNLVGNEDNTFYLSYWRYSLEQKLVCQYGKSLKSFHLHPDKYYLLIHSKWFNYSFWINSFLSRLILAEKQFGLENLTLIYPSEWDDIPYVKDSLQCFDIKIEKIPLDHHLFVPNLIMPETREWTASFYAPHIVMVKEKILPFAQKYSKLNIFYDNIYLTRKKRNVRCVDNEEDLYPILEKYNFKILNFEDYSFWDQVMLMHNAKNFVSIHGAGFSNVLFMPQGASVLELVNQRYAELEYKFPFWKLSSSCGLKYFVQFGQVQTNSSLKLRRDFKHDLVNDFLVEANICLDVSLFEKNILAMLEK